MALKATFVICFQVFLIQCAYSQAIPNQVYNNGLELEVEAVSRGGPSALRGFSPNWGAGRIGMGPAGIGSLGLGLSGLNYGVPDVAAVASVPVTGPFTATGNAELAVGGEFNAAGQTVVGGQIPVIGAVSFSGQIPASGVVSIAGNCGCSNIPL